MCVYCLSKIVSLSFFFAASAANFLLQLPMSRNRCQEEGRRTSLPITNTQALIEVQEQAQAQTADILSATKIVDASRRHRVAHHKTHSNVSKSQKLAAPSLAADRRIVGALQTEDYDMHACT